VDLDANRRRWDSATFCRPPNFKSSRCRTTAPGFEKVDHGRSRCVTALNSACYWKWASSATEYENRVVKTPFDPKREQQEKSGLLLLIFVKTSIIVSESHEGDDAQAVRIGKACQVVSGLEPNY